MQRYLQQEERLEFENLFAKGVGLQELMQK
jgi:hypothetical protein